MIDELTASKIKVVSTHSTSREYFDVHHDEKPFVVLGPVKKRVRYFL
jgi:hypothetical protein